MGFLEILIIAVGLSMDAFAVSISLGLSACKSLDRPAANSAGSLSGHLAEGQSLKGPDNIWLFVLPGIYFGFFQALMPLIGYYGGTLFARHIQGLDHWIAFVLLAIIGGKMIKDSFSKGDEGPEENPLQFIRMLLLALATSIDALAVGITFSFFSVNIFNAILITGLTTFCISLGGVKVGTLCGSKFRSHAEFFGGIVLVAMGTKILIEHLFFI